MTELLLHQTQATQVKRMWEGFFDSFPGLQALHEASEEAIFRKISELGFGNQRTKTLQAVAEHILEKEDGSVPHQESRLLMIPGVGDYTAAAVQCFAFGKRVPIVDANVMRLAGRLEGREVAQRDVRRNDWIWEWAHARLPDGNVGAHNYGLLDFGALMCTPRSPSCSTCALLEACPCGKIVQDGSPPPYP
jgi:A/G-specific adenine glycosylase